MVCFRFYNEYKESGSKMLQSIAIYAWAMNVYIINAPWYQLVLKIASLKFY